MMRSSRPALDTGPALRPRHNPAIVPGSLLSVRDLWQQVADSLPDDSLLVVVPTADSAQQLALATTALLLKAAGHHVVTLPAEHFAPQTAMQGELRLN
jgi:hypothetical protein